MEMQLVAFVAVVVTTTKIVTLKKYEELLLVLILQLSLCFREADAVKAATCECENMN